MHKYDYSLVIFGVSRKTEGVAEVLTSVSFT